MPAPLSDALVDAFLANLDQLPADHQGPTGRIKTLVNAQTTHYTHASQFNPAKIELEPRKGFESLSTDVRDVNGDPIGGATWGTSSLLDTFDDQLVNVDDRKPRVYNGYDAWTEYSDVRILANQIREDSLVGGYGISTTPDSSVMNHVQAVVFTQHPRSDQWQIWLGFRELPGSQTDVDRRADPLQGAWIVPPKIIATESTPAVATVLNNGGQFFVIWNTDNTTHDFSVYAYDGNGALLGTTTFPKLDTSREPGWWDVIVNKAIDPDAGITLLHAQPAGSTSNPATDVHVRFTMIYWNGSSVIASGSTDATIICNGWCNFLENDFATTDSFLVTTGPSDTAQHVRGWRVRNFAQIHSWDIADVTPKIDAITGYVPAGSGPDLFSVVGTLEASSSVGPQFDPQQRRIFTYQTNDGASTLVRTSASQALVSKTTKIGDDRFSATFYESGSGLGTGASTLTPLVTAGDYFTGTGRQSVKIGFGSYFTGPPTNFVVPTRGINVVVTQVVAAQNIDGAGTPDSVVNDFVPGTTIPALKWTFKNLASSSNVFGGLLKVNASSILTANFSWEILYAGAGPTSIWWTKTNNTVGGTVAPGTFSTTGTAEIVSRTLYAIPNLTDKYDSLTTDFLIGGTMTVTLNAVGANNGAKTIHRAVALPTSDVNSFGFGPGIWILTGSEVTNGTSFTAALSSFGENAWSLTGGQIFASPLVGGALVVDTDEIYPVNVTGGTGLEITAVAGHGINTGAGDDLTMRSQVFGFVPEPTLHIELSASKVPFTFFIQALASDLATNAFRFRGALLQVTSDNASVAGLYRIIDFGPALDGTLYTERVTQADDIPAYDFVTDDGDAFLVLFPVATTQPFQPTYFLTPAIGARATVGMFDRENAYNNWRIDGINTLDGHLTHVTTVNGSLFFVAPTTQERVNTANANQQILQSAIVGIKSWSIFNEFGTAANGLIPGCQGLDYDSASFPEDGFALAPETPWLVEVGTTAGGAIGLQKGGTYTYTVIVESQDSAGRRVSSPPSPPLIIGPLAGNNNQITIGGDLPLPWDIGPTSPSNTYGVTNRAPVVISIYRTSYVNGLETTTQYKITSDLQPNALAPISTSNASGFSFSNGQFEYIDANPDLVIQVNEPCYANVALPRFGAPAFSDAEFWNDRYWLIDPAGNTWFSTAVTDGSRPSWFPGFRIAPPVNDRPVAIRQLQQFLIATCEKSVFYLPATALPSVVLAEAGQIPIPSWIPLPFPNGSTGHAITTPAGVMYASTAIEIYNVTRSLTNDPVSLNAVDLFNAVANDNQKIQGITIDGDQRMMISTGNDPIVYDLVSGLWSQWTLPLSVGQICTWNGRFACRAEGFVLLQTDFPIDHVNDVTSGVDWSVILAGLSFSSVRAFVRLRRMQVVGKYRAPHLMQVKFRYPDDFPNDPTLCPVLRPDGSAPYLIEAIPGHGRASQFEVEIDVTHDSDTGHGDSCSIEVLSCKIGIQSGQRQVPPGQRV